MDLKFFTEKVLDIKNSQHLIQSLWETLNPELTDKLFKIVDISISILHNVFDDKEGWIDWFCFENDFGNKHLQVSINNEDMDLDTIEKLYKVLTNK